MICDICGVDKAHIRHITRVYGEKDNFFIIENIPVISCQNCGESYLTASTMKELDAMKKKKKTEYKDKIYPTAQFV